MPARRQAFTVGRCSRRSLKWFVSMSFCTAIRILCGIDWSIGRRREEESIVSSVREMRQSMARAIRSEALSRTSTTSNFR